MKQKVLFLVFALFISVNAKAQDPFITIWNLNNPGSVGQIEFDVLTAGLSTYYWESLTTPGLDGSGGFNFGFGGTLVIPLPPAHIIRLTIYTPNFRRINISNGPDRKRLTIIQQWGDVAWSTMQGAFMGCENMQITATDVPNLSSVTSLGNMFQNCTSLNTGNLNSWDVSTITNMQSMFAGATSFNRPLNSWSVGNVINMSSMFEGASVFNQPLNSWNVSSVTNMTDLFKDATEFNQPLSAWDPVEVTGMAGMFAGAISFNQPLNAWGNKITKVVTMNSMFAGATNFNQTLSNWDISNVTGMFGMFNGASSFNQSLSAWGPRLNNTVNLNNFLNNSGLSVANYDATLISFNNSGPNGRTMGALGLRYCTAAPERANLDPGPKNWTIIGDALANFTPTFGFSTNLTICSGANVPTLVSTSTDFTGNGNVIVGNWSPNTISNINSGVYTFTPNPGQCATTLLVSVTIRANLTPIFTGLPTLICSGDFIAPLPSFSNNSVIGNWSPALNSNATTVYTFTPITASSINDCATSIPLTITVNPILTPTFNTIPTTICSGDFIAPLPLVSDNGIAGEWFTVDDVTGGLVPAVLNNAQTTAYTFVPAPGQCAVNTIKIITVNPVVTATFRNLPTICSEDVAALPSASSEGITGTWSVSLVLDNTTAVYVFTPDPGQCSTTAILTITGNPVISPTFTLPAICSGDVASLPLVSDNGITGTWPLNLVSGNNYVFTPDLGQCATLATFTITIIPSTTPTFAPIQAICQGDPAPNLTTTSINTITGTWLPSTISTLSSGVYTFTPNPGQCATIATLSVTINPNLVPSFTAVAPICNGAALANLPTLSTNGFTGGWSPTINNTLTTNYTFTPDAGQCATLATLTVTVNPNLLPSFTAVAPICQGAALANLPTLSTNGFTGGWSPTINNMLTTNYTFTPDAGQCATIATLTVTVNPNLLPSFTAVAPICQGAALANLPTLSTNGFTGVWSPTINNTLTTNYTFTPDAGQCATIATLTITVNPNLLPAFTPVAPICEGTALANLPTLSTNGFNGVWSPVLDNTTTTSYTFTPSPGQCATVATLVITVTTKTIPEFSLIAPICKGASLADLQIISTNLITGTWAPVLDNTKTTTYTFTPQAKQCATTAALVIEVVAFPEIELGADLYAGIGEELRLTASTDSLVAWWPSNGLTCVDCTSPSFVADSTVVFYAQAANRLGCKTIDSVRVFVDTKNSFYIPNTFSPNGDRVNDIFDVVCYKKLSYTMKVYDRWGQLMYNWTDKEMGWDGTHRGGNCVQDVYVYVFQATENYKPVKLQGTVTLIR